jgi:hypothetical protein
MHSGAYLHNSWNILDFIVVAAGLVAVIPGVPNVSALRTFRVLRPLRSLNAVPGLRRLVGSLLGSLPDMANVLLLLLFIFSIFGILGLQIWSGVFHQRCRLTPWPVKLQPGPEPLAGPYPWRRGDVGWEAVPATPDLTTVGWVNKSYNTTTFHPFPPTDAWLKEVTANPHLHNCSTAYPYPEAIPGNPQLDCFWPLDRDDERLCGGYHTCSDGKTCGAARYPSGQVRFKATLANDDMQGVEGLQWGLSSFDSFPPTMLLIFQSLTMEGWTTIMYMGTDASNRVLATIYFVSLIMIGSWFVMNLTLAVVLQQYVYRDQQNEREENEAR